MSFIEKLRKKPEKTKRKILWGTVLLTGFILIILWFLHLKYNFSNFNLSNFKGPDINKESFREVQEKINKGLNSFKDSIKETEKEIERTKDQEEYQKPKK